MNCVKNKSYIRKLFLILVFFMFLPVMSQAEEILCFDPNCELDNDVCRNCDLDFKSTSPRFTDIGDGTVVDNLTGLMWLKFQVDLGFSVRPEALDIVADFNAHPDNHDVAEYTATHTDWRLPSVNEFICLIGDPDVPEAFTWLRNEQPFSALQQGSYWTAETSSCFQDLAVPVQILIVRITKLKPYRFSC